ncbi:MAG: serine/threonine protein kinase [Deltaproteobacteria bacterium]|nr:serine/threonine protein kinase [Deltaproteobacteria bacterium]
MSGWKDAQTEELPAGAEGRAGGSRTGLVDSERLGRYELLYELAAGGMATLYLARATGPAGFEKLVAIKRIHPHLAKQRYFVDMFLDEARIAARLQHPNVAQIFDLGESNGSFYIAMEYVEGESLSRLVGETLRQQVVRSDPPRMPLVEAATIVADAAAGLHAAHELRGGDGQSLNLVHRDVSPHNILITYDGFVKLVDFGVAKARGRITSTTDRQLKGKIPYMSPEQAQGLDLDRRSDVFSLGIVLYEVTCARRLFKHDSEMGTLSLILGGQIPPPSAVVPGYPLELEQVVLRALAMRPADRFQTADEMRRAIQQSLLVIGSVAGASEIGGWMRRVFSDRMQIKARLRESGETGVAPPPDIFCELGSSGSIELSFEGVPREPALAPTISEGKPTASRSRSRSLLLAAAVVIAAGAATILGGRAWLNWSAPTAATSAPAIAAAPSDAALPDAAPTDTRPAAVAAASSASAPAQPAIALAPAKKVAARVRPPKKESRDEQASGLFSLKTTPWAEVWLRGKRLGETPLVGVKLPVGQHTLELRSQGKLPGRKLKIAIRADEHLRREIDLR